jgi:Protein of unknown function (DUF3500)
MSAASDIAHAVASWLGVLDDAQREAATFAFDEAERSVWAFTPDPPRRGLMLADMDAGQRRAAMAIVEAGLSARAAAEVATIMALETTLGAIERAAGRRGWERRDPDRYWFAVFGDPAGAAPWSWRVGGHHVAVHLTMSDDRVIGTAPSFLGANPAVIPSGPQVGDRALTGEETFARALLAELTPDQRRVAIVDPVAPPEIHSGNGARADVRGVPTGIRHGALDRAGQMALERLVRHYVDRSRPDLAEADWSRLEDGLGALTFAWAGPDTPGRGHYYAIQGPTLLIEYDNTQNGANHIHAVRRDLVNDWGEDLLAAHYRTAHPAG